MVIQRNAQVNIWSWAPAEKVIEVHFMGKSYSTTVDANGEWLVRLQTANAGGPYDMVIETGAGAERITVSNILLGDVWLCSGQSNMGMSMLSVKDDIPMILLRPAMIPYGSFWFR
jgi:sialate O-acetylesterase